MCVSKHLHARLLSCFFYIYYICYWLAHFTCSIHCFWSLDLLSVFVSYCTVFHSNLFDNLERLVCGFGYLVFVSQYSVAVTCWFLWMINIYLFLFFSLSKIKLNWCVCQRGVQSIKGLRNTKKKTNRHHRNAIKIAIKKCFGNFCEISLWLNRAMKMLHAYKMDAVV